MEWAERNLDDALFPSMLLPVIEKAFETLFPVFPEEKVESGVSATMIFHQELGLVLHSESSRRLLPKVSFGTGWDEATKTVKDALLPEHRPEVERVIKSRESFSGAYPLLPDRIEEWEGLFFWTLTFEGGQVLVLRATSLADARSLHQDFSLRSQKVENSLTLLLSQWMLDGTCEVFWSRILSNVGADFQPVPGQPSPEWIRTVPLSRSDSPRVFRGEYLNIPRHGWKRSVKLLPPGLTPRRRRRSEVGDKGKALEVPVDLWGLYPLGTVHLPVNLLRTIDSQKLLSRLREARSLALRSLYRHLIYPGPLSFLLWWSPEANSFDLSLLKELPAFAGEESLGSAVMTVRLESRGLAASLERSLRPVDLVFSEGAGAASRTLFLSGCDPALAKSAVLPRILAIEGIEERHVGGICTLADTLKDASSRR
ncbi:MAG: hypothetical protein ACP5OP_05950 [Leptospirillia bacterium]